MKDMLIKYLAVAGAGALGAIARYFVASQIAPWRDFPLGTMVINISGSLFLGWFMTVAGDRIQISETTRIAMATGFVGAYTTFSTYMFESDKLLQDGNGIRAMVYLLGSLVLGLLAVRAGVILGHKM